MLVHLHSVQVNEHTLRRPRASPNRLGPLLFSATRTTHDAQACIEMCIKSDALSAECPSGKSALSAECQQVLKKFCALSAECLSDIVFQLEFKVSTQHYRASGSSSFYELIFCQLVLAYTVPLLLVSAARFPKSAHPPLKMY